jgi:hypothetical protein
MPHQGTPPDVHSSLVPQILRGTQNDSRRPVILSDSLWPVILSDSRRPVILSDSRRPVILSASLWPVILSDSLWPVILSAAKNLSSLLGNHPSLDH